MPIGKFEGEILRLLAVNRNPDSFVGGATVLNQAADTPRASQDIDLFHDEIQSVVQSAERDIATLRAVGYEVEDHRPQDTFRRARIRRGSEQTKIEWVHDSAFRFFPIEKDVELGWRLNFWDAATNKLLAMVSRREVRDYLDMVHLHQTALPLGALAWAAAAKDPGLTPEYILEWARRHSAFSPDEWAKLVLARPLNLVAMKKIWMEGAEFAETLIEKLPPSEMGCFYLNAEGKPVCPEPDSPEFSKLTRHFGSVKGAWPRIVE
jgi:hypothetical protein